MESLEIDASTWLPALTALAGVLLGSVLGFLGKLIDESIRRRNRRELYAPKVFERRLAAYETLSDLISSGSAIASQVIYEDDLTDEERHDLISGSILKIAIFVDSHPLYIDEELGAHCTALFMSVEDIHNSNPEDKERLVRHYNDMRNDAFRMIAEESGVAEINRLFKSINRPKLSGPIIERIRELRKPQNKQA